MRTFFKIFFVAVLLVYSEFASAYPIDGFTLTGIRRLVRLQMIMKGEIKDTKPIEGAQKKLADIHLQLMNTKGDSLASLKNLPRFFREATTTVKKQICPRREMGDDRCSHGSVF
jgi:hypothetical protein